MNSLFITFEGVDGSGKTTQSKLLYDYLKSLDKNVILTREPGGTLIGEKIRDIIIDKTNEKMSKLTEAFLYVASRSQHVSEIIRPALLENKIVICDRFLDSSIAYQGYARGLGSETIEIINSYATGGLSPDITFMIDLSVEEALSRKTATFSLDRIESENLEFHNKVYEGYKKLTEKNATRIVVINGALEKEKIFDIIKEHLTEYITD